LQTRSRLATSRSRPVVAPAQRLLARYSRARPPRQPVSRAGCLTREKLSSRRGKGGRGGGTVGGIDRERGVMADLQSAATVIVLPGDAAADPGRVLAERPACLVTDPAARQAGARLAADLDVPVRVLDDDASSGGL